MATLLAVYNSEACVGRCDARCYDAVGGDCDCVCGGKNHGKGLRVAFEQTRKQFEKMVDRYEAAKGEEFETVKIPALQLSFDEMRAADFGDKKTR